MTEPSQYFKGRTVQEQMNEVIGYVDVRAEEVAAAKADDVLEPAEQAKTDAIAAKEAAEDAQEAAEQAVTDAAAVLANVVKKTGEASQSIAGDIAVAGNLSGGTVTVPTPVNNTDAVNKKYVDDQDALKISISDINSFAVGLTGNQSKSGNLTMYESGLEVYGSNAHDVKLHSRWLSSNTTSYNDAMPQIEFISSDNVVLGRLALRCNSGIFELIAQVYNHDTTMKTVKLVVGDN